MAKQKQKHIASDSEKKKKNKKHKGDLEVDPLDEGNWTIVKKQRITILIPPLPGSVECTMPNVKESVCQSPTKTNSETQPSLEISVSKESVDEKEKSISLSPSEKPISSLDGREISICRNSKPNNGKIVCISNNSLLGRRMRAINLDRKIKKAGGLENWLFSVGLNCFVNIFQKNKVNKFQLSNLTMNKLQDMGAYAVGPRRKLMHAIGCLSQPHCFRHVNL